MVSPWLAGLAATVSLLIGSWLREGAGWLLDAGPAFLLPRKSRLIAGHVREKPELDATQQGRASSQASPGSFRCRVGLWSYSTPSLSRNSSSKRFALGCEFNATPPWTPSQC